MDGEHPSSRTTTHAEGELTARSTANAQALKELAMALRTSVETMHGVRDLQAELVTTLKRQDRSELVLQSTQVLNDTFRNLATIQRELLTRLEGAQKPHGSTSRLVPLMLLGLLVVFLGGVFLVLDVLQQMRAERLDFVAGTQEAADQKLDAYREGKEEALREAEAREARLTEELDLSQARATALRQRLDEEARAQADLEAEKRALEAERDGFADQIRAAQSEVLARRAVEEELKDVSGKLAVVEPRMAQLQHDLEREKAETERLRVRLGAIGLGHPDPGHEDPPAGRAEPGRDGLTPPSEPRTERPPPEDVVAAAAVPPSPVEAPPPVASPDPPPTDVTRDRVLLEKIRSRLNQMLNDSATRKQDVWQVTRIDGVSPEGLIGVIALRYDRKSGRLLEQVEAAGLEVWVDRNRHAVDVEFKNGRRTRGSGYENLPGGSLRQQVADGEFTRIWSQSGMAFMRFR